MCLRLGPGQRRALDANNTSASGAIFDNYLTLILFPHALGRNVHEACTYRDTNSLVDIGGNCGYSTNGSGGQFWGRKFAFHCFPGMSFACLHGNHLLDLYWCRHDRRNPLSVVFRTLWGSVHVGILCGE